MGCECYQIGGPFITYDPNCEVHAPGGFNDQMNEVCDQVFKLEKECADLRTEVARLREGLGDAINFMKDAKKVSIKSRGIQLEAEFPEVMS